MLDQFRMSCKRVHLLDTIMVICYIYAKQQTTKGEDLLIIY